MRLNLDDLARLIRACDYYKEKTGSEYMWDEYDKLQDKLRALQEDATPAE